MHFMFDFQSKIFMFSVVNVTNGTNLSKSVVKVVEKIANGRVDAVTERSHECSLSSSAMNDEQDTLLNTYSFKCTICSSTDINSYNALKIFDYSYLITCHYSLERI